MTSRRLVPAGDDLRHVERDAADDLLTQVVVRSDHSLANQQHAAFIPTPNWDSPLASAGGLGNAEGALPVGVRDAGRVVADHDETAVLAVDSISMRSL